MSNFPLRLGALTLVSVVGLGLGQRFLGQEPRLAFLSSANAQVADGSPTQSAPAAALDQAPSIETPHTDAKNRHLAPYGTLYLLSYVSAKTDKGVVGFVPGQRVHVIEAHRSTHTLVVGDGEAQVEVPPSKLTNDLDIAELVRQHDQANQARVAAYIQAEEAAYSKAQREAADATAKDLEQRKQEQREQQAQVAAANTAQPTPATADQTANATSNGNGYYGNGGYGYGSPYGYFSGGGGSNTVILLPSPAPAAAPAAAPIPNQVAAPAAPHNGAGKSK